MQPLGVLLGILQGLFPKTLIWRIMPRRFGEGDTASGVYLAGKTYSYHFAEDQQGIDIRHIQIVSAGNQFRV